MLIAERDSRIVVVVTMLLGLVTGCTRSCSPPREQEPGWQPGWIEDHPPLHWQVDAGPIEKENREVHLRWRFGEDPFALEMHNDVQIEMPEGVPGSIQTQAEGRVEFVPAGDGTASVLLSSSLGGGQSPPLVKGYRIDEDGDLVDADPAVQAMLDRSFPTTEKPLSAGTPIETSFRLQAEDGVSETRGTTRLGLIGFQSIGGIRCALVAMEHEESVWVTSGDGNLVETGSRTVIRLVGRFDPEAGRWVSIVVREHSVTERPEGEAETWRVTSYILEELA